MRDHSVPLETGGEANSQQVQRPAEKISTLEEGAPNMAQDYVTVGVALLVRTTSALHSWMNVCFMLWAPEEYGNVHLADPSPLLTVTLG